MKSNCPWGRLSFELKNFEKKGIKKRSMIMYLFFLFFINYLFNIEHLGTLIYFQVTDRSGQRSGTSLTPVF